MNIEDGDRLKMTVFYDCDDSRLARVRALDANRLRLTLVSMQDYAAQSSEEYKSAIARAAVVVFVWEKREDVGAILLLAGYAVGRGCAVLIIGRTSADVASICKSWEHCHVFNVLDEASVSAIADIAEHAVRTYDDLMRLYG